MKKSLFALAALGAFAGAAQAQSSVTLYGNLDATFVHSAGSTSANTLAASANSTSLWGLTGSEDMGGGMKAGFDLKSELNLSTGQTGSSTNVPATATLTSTGLPNGGTVGPLNTGAASNLFNRGANLFISSAQFGEVKLGRMDDIEWAMSGQYSTSQSNSFGSNQGHAAITNVAGSGVGTTCTVLKGNTAIYGLPNNGYCTVGGTSTSQGNGSSYDGTADAFTAGIQYSTPTFYGVSAKVQSSMGAAGASSAAGSGFWTGGQQAAGISYAGNGLSLGASQARRMDEQGILASVFTTFGAKYEVTPKITLTGIYTTTQYVNNSLNFAPTAGFSGSSAGSPVGLAGNNMYSFGVNYKTSPNSDVSLAYTNITSDAYSANSATIYGLTGRYNLSKRTQMYAGIGETVNQGGYALSPVYGDQTYTSSGTNAGASIGGTIWATMVGLKHTF